VPAAFSEGSGGACRAEADAPQAAYFSSSVTLDAGAGGAATVTGLTSDW
jgi:hypothetical protein